jgi:tagatose 1,6-diphosphate aldolase
VGLCFGEIAEPGGDLLLRFAGETPADPARGFVPSRDYDLYVRGVPGPVGRVNVRTQTTPLIERSNGHIGYRVDAAHRGRHLAERAVRLLFPVLRELGLTTLWITCDPGNAASRRTCERLGANFVDIVPIGEDHEMYARGERERARYRRVL